MINKDLSVKHCLKRKKELFEKFDIDYIINNSSKIEMNDIYDLKLNENLFNIEEHKYYSIFIAIIDKDDNSVLETRNINKYVKNKEITFNLRYMKNNKILDNYWFYISIIPVIEEKKEIIKDFVKIFYLPMNLFPNYTSTKNKFQIFSLLLIIFSMFFTISQVYITKKLIEDYGLVDNLINNISVFNSIIYYIYDSFIIKNWIAFLSMYVIVLIVFLIPGVTNYVFDLVIFIWKRTCRHYKLEHLYLKIKLKNNIYDIKSHLKEIFFNPSFLFKYTLGYIVIMIILFVPVMKFFSDLNLKQNLNYKGKIIEEYFKSSSFPEFAKIKMLDSSEIDVLMIGYDSTYTYYYTYEYINDKLSKHFKLNVDENGKNKKKMNTSEIYAYYLNDISKEKIKYIKNTDYKTIEVFDPKYYVLTDKE